MNIEDKLVCPHCGKEIRKIGASCNIYSHYDLEGNWLEDVDRGYIESYYCVACGEELPREITDRLEW